MSATANTFSCAVVTPSGKRSPIELGPGLGPGLGPELGLSSGALRRNRPNKLLSCPEPVGVAPSDWEVGGATSDWRVVLLP